MRISVRHETAYTYASAPHSIIQVLRLTPRSHEGQHVLDWRIDCDVDCRLNAGEDAFGNITHTLSVSEPVTSLTLVAEGSVETLDTFGVVVRAVERFPTGLYLRDTELTLASPGIQELARDTDGNGNVEWLHNLMDNVHEAMTFDVDPTHSGTSAAEGWRLRRGVCQDYAHVFIAAARVHGLPARYVSGHIFRTDGIVSQEAGHAWAEVYVEGLGWTGFDPANNMSPAGGHIRVACGLDYLDAAPVRGVRTAGGVEEMAVRVLVEQASAQSQN